MKPKYKGRQSVLRVKQVEEPLSKTFTERLTGQLIEGARRGWREGRGK